MSSCCSHFECEATQQFNQKKVEQELKRYRMKGPGPTTRLLVDGISQSGVLAGTVLDVGSGFGGLTLALLERGASSGIAVDASAAYVGAARDEAHRFAITFHRKLRQKAATRSVLDEIPGVGPKRRRELLRHFGSVARVQKASQAELVELVGQKLGAIVYESPQARR